VHVNSGERGKLICLTTYARKAHFHYQQESHVYVLDLLKEIPEFVRTVLPVWKRYFAVELDDNVRHLEKASGPSRLRRKPTNATVPASGSSGSSAPANVC